MTAITDFLRDHWSEIVIGALFALVFGVLIELLGIAGWIRGIVRHVKNKLSEKSKARLAQRIGELETHRDLIASYLSSDKALYLTAMRTIIGSLFLMCLGALTIIFDELMYTPGPNPNPVVWGLQLANRPMLFCAMFCFGIAVVATGYGLTLASLDNRAKIAELVAKHDADIEHLKEKLRNWGA